MKYRSCIIGLALLSSSVGVYAATGEILDNQVATDADIPTLRAEEQLFESIRKGIVLTITECEHQDSCAPNVNREELQQLVEKLNARITSLALRHSETGEKELEDILLTYADMRDGYKEMIDKLANLSVTKEGETKPGTEEDVFSDAGEDSAGAENKEELYNDLFKDIDEGL
jgi:TolA-binding protein